MTRTGLAHQVTRSIWSRPTADLQIDLEIDLLKASTLGSSSRELDSGGVASCAELATELTAMQLIDH